MLLLFNCSNYHTFHMVYCYCCRAQQGSTLFLPWTGFRRRDVHSRDGSWPMKRRPEHMRVVAPTLLCGRRLQMSEAIYTVAIPSGCAICALIQSFFPILGDSKWVMFLSTVSHAFRSISWRSFYEEVSLKCQTKVSCLTERSMRSWSDELPPRMFTHFRPLLVRPYCYCRLRECETWNHKIGACEAVPSPQVFFSRTCAKDSRAKYFEFFR